MAREVKKKTGTNSSSGTAASRKPTLELPRIRFTIVRNYLLYAHEIVRRCWRRVLGASAIFILIMTVIHLAAIQLVLSLVHIREQQNVLLSLTTLPFTAYFLSGLIRYLIAICRRPLAGGQPEVGVESQSEGEGAVGWSTFWLVPPRAYLHMLLFLVYYYFLYVCLVKVVVDFREYEGIIQIRMVAGLFFFLWLAARFIFAPLFILDGDRNVRAALRHSYLLTTRRTRRTLLFVVLLLAILWLGILALGVGAVYTLPLVLITIVLIYDNYRSAAPERLKLLEFGHAPGQRRSGTRKKVRRKKVAKASKSGGGRRSS